jgi:hypothetical protein
MNPQRTISTDSPKPSSRMAGYRSRYHAFLNQQTQKAHQTATRVAGFGQSLTNVAIFAGLLIAILTLFGFGLSQLKPGQAQQNRDVQTEQATVAGASAGQLPAKPAVRADAKKKARK